MAAKKVDIKKRLTASTLLEVVVAMVIIVVVFGLAMTIYSNVMRLSLSARKLKAHALLQHELIRLQKAPDSYQPLENKELRVEFSTAAFEGKAELLKVNLIAYDDTGKKLAEVHKLILNDQQ